MATRFQAFLAKTTRAQNGDTSLTATSLIQPGYEKSLRLFLCTSSALRPRSHKVVYTCLGNKPRLYIIMCFLTPNGPMQDEIVPFEPMPPSPEPLRDMVHALYGIRAYMEDPTQEPHTDFSQSDPHPAFLEHLCKHLSSWQTETPGLDPNEFDIDEEQCVLLLFLNLRYKLDQNLLHPPVLVPLLDRWLNYAIDLAIWHDLNYEHPL